MKSVQQRSDMNSSAFWDTGLEARGAGGRDARLEPTAMVYFSPFHDEGKNQVNGVQSAKPKRHLRGRTKTIS